MEQSDPKLDALRALAKEGFDALDQGEYITLHSREEIDAFMQEIYDEVIAGLSQGTHRK